MTRLLHLARRFFGSLRPGGPSAEGQRWAESLLVPKEQVIWCALSGPDRRHSVDVAKRVQADLGSQATRPILAAALLHDCGKLQSRLRTPGRVAATILGATVVRTSTEVKDWSSSTSSWKRSVGRYRDHPEGGAQMLVEAGSDPITVTWTREHHLSSSHWTLDPVVAKALHRADDD